jgi:hypothetical protein
LLIVGKLITKGKRPVRPSFAQTAPRQFANSGSTAAAESPATPIETTPT